MQRNNNSRIGDFGLSPLEPYVRSNRWPTIREQLIETLIFQYYFRERKSVQAIART